MRNRKGCGGLGVTRAATSEADHSPRPLQYPHPKPEPKPKPKPKPNPRCPPSFRVFGCQNPLQQGGGRKGLPKSFLNRFTQVWMEELDAEDMLLIVLDQFPQVRVRVRARVRVGVRVRAGAPIAHRGLATARLCTDVPPQCRLGEG